MRCSQQLQRIIKEEIENLDYGTIRIIVNKSGAYTEIATERKVRVIKNSDEIASDEGSFHKG